MGPAGTALLLAYLALVLLAASYTWYILWGMPDLDPDLVPPEAPLVSIVVPVRNEAAVVGLCAQSLLASGYPHREVIFVDGGSTDGTLDVLRGFGDGLRVLEEPPLPPGWVGKNWACHTGARMARGEFLLFSDGDTVHSPRALPAAMAKLRAEGADLLTLYPRLIRRGFWEKLMLPVVAFLIVVRHRGRFVNRDDRPYFIGVGPFLLIKRTVYDAIGGHAAVRDRIDEDFRLGQRVKEAGYRLRAFRGHRVVQLRMYERLDELWEGWVKNIAPGLDYSAGKVAFGILLALVFFLAPFVLLGLGIPMFLGGGGALTLAVGAVAAVAAMATLSPVYVDEPIDVAFLPLIPLAAIVFTAMALTSLYLHRYGGGVTWKGRRYKPLVDDQRPE